MSNVVYEATINVATAPQRRGDVVLQKWVDKNTLPNAGDILVGTGGETDMSVTINGATTTVCVANVASISAGIRGYPLISNGPLALPSYQQVPRGGIADGAVVISTIPMTSGANQGQLQAQWTGGSIQYYPITATSVIPSGVSTSAIANYAVGTAQIANLAVGSLQIANAAVGPVQIANMAVETKIGLETSFSTGSASVPVNITGKYGLYSIMVPDFHVNNDQYYAGNPGLLSFLFEYNSIMQAAVYKTYMSDSFSVLNYYLPVGYKIIKSAFTPYTYTPEYTDMIQLVIEPVNSSGSITGVQMSVYHVWIPSSPDTTTPSREQLAFQYRRLISFNQ